MGIYTARYGLDGQTIEQVAFRLEALTSEHASGLTARLLSALTSRPDTGASIRFVFRDGKLSRFLRLHGPAPFRPEAALADDRQLRSFEAREEFDGSFHAEGLIAQLTNRPMDAMGVAVYPGHVFAGLFSEICGIAALSGFDFEYQINLGSLSDRSELLRLARRTEVHLGELDGAPKKLILHQRRWARGLEKAQACADELFLFPDRESYSACEGLVRQAFAQDRGEYGFPDAHLDLNEEHEATWVTGLYERFFEPLTPSEELARALPTGALEKLLETQPPGRPEPAKSNVLPRAVSDKAGFDVFISYSSADQAVANAICHFLEERGVRCWIAPRDIGPGDIWSDAIMKGIRASRVTVMLLSDTSNASRYVLREIEQTVSMGHPVVPLRIAEVMPSDSMSFFVSSHHWFDAITDPLEAHLPPLLEAVKVHLR